MVKLSLKNNMKIGNKNIWTIKIWIKNETTLDINIMLGSTGDESIKLNESRFFSFWYDLYNPKLDIIKIIIQKYTITNSCLTFSIEIEKRNDKIIPRRNMDSIVSLVLNSNFNSLNIKVFSILKS